MFNKSMDHKFLLFLCRSRSLPPDSGLSMLEVLVAMMVVFFTMMGALNGLLYATLFQVKAERQAQATYWIQQDLENVKSLAAAQATNTALCTSAFSTSYAGALKTTVDAITPSTSNPLLTRYSMIRTTAGTNTNPQILTISYTVRETSDTTKVLATLYTEVMPPQALSCS
ncbi:MAG: prepilin-type cleavage/methylation domain-containing protein [Snowella sp.]|jgi:Tfp pilus assembly protein PilV|nr:MAG: prepilin-type cleavage/methylation domain-containing protein [Snowella sp.]